MLISLDGRWTEVPPKGGGPTFAQKGPHHLQRFDETIQSLTAKFEGDAHYKNNLQWSHFSQQNSVHWSTASQAWLHLAIGARGPSLAVSRDMVPAE